jgi:hypothetical protein
MGINKAGNRVSSRDVHYFDFGFLYESRSPTYSYYFSRFAENSTIGDIFIRRQAVIRYKKFSFRFHASFLKINALPLNMNLNYPLSIKQRKKISAGVIIQYIPVFIFPVSGLMEKTNIFCYRLELGEKTDNFSVLFKENKPEGCLEISN